MSRGIYQHVDRKYVDRYLAEYDFRHNARARFGINDDRRTAIAVAGAARKAEVSGRLRVLAVASLFRLWSASDRSQRPIWGVRTPRLGGTKCGAVTHSST
jgi:hypothetical protein